MSDNDAADFLQSLTFTPGWAKAPSAKQRFEEHADDPQDRGAGARDGRPRREGSQDRGEPRGAWRGGQREGGGERRPPRPPVRAFNGEPPAAVRPREPLRRPDAFADRGPPRDGARRPDSFADRGAPSFHRDDRFGARAPMPEPVDYPVEVRFLPEPKALAVVVHKVARGHRAFPLRDLARLFLDNPASCEVRLDVKPGREGVSFHQCSRCGFVALSEAELRAHAVGTHFAEDFSTETVEGEPPTGSFVCVARCGITGKLLAPPNHHSFNQRVLDQLRTECRHVPEDVYRSRIEMVHEPEAVQQWREASRQRTVYRRKVAEGAEPGAVLERAEAEASFANDTLPGLMTAPKHVSCTHAVALQLRDPVLAAAVQDAWHREQRYPASLFFALRGAFRHKRMHVFRAGEGRGIDFVMARVPVPLDVQHAVPELKAIADHLITKPGCARSELLADLGVPPEGPQTPEQERIVQQLVWITERGHIIEYYNGVLALPEEHPVFRYVQDHRPTRAPAPRPERAPSSTPKSAAKPEDAVAETAVDLESLSDVSADAVAEVAAAEPPAAEVAAAEPPAAEVDATV